MASLDKIIDVHSHIITNLGSQVPTHKLPPWSIEQSMSLMDANGIGASVPGPLSLLCSQLPLRLTNGDFDV
jgi:hypothetical protein